ncbi:MAG: GNAT family N-acetyltransferase [Thermodesulfobacteriota bacterium]
MKFSKYISDNADEIKNLFTKTFSDSEGKSEGLLIGELAYNLISQTDKKDIYVFVAKEDEDIIGSCIFTRFKFENDNVDAFLMSPVAVITNFQGKGTGQEMINFGLNSLGKDGVKLVFTYGDPKFYSKTGFRHIDENSIKPPFKLKYPEGWLVKSLNGFEIKPITGRSFCVDAINKPEFW